MRDSQKSLVYESEFVLRDIYKRAAVSGNPMVEMNGAHITLPPEARFGNVETIQSYVDRVLQMPSVIEVFGESGRVLVRKRKGVTKAHYQMGEIAIPDTRSQWALREVVVLHELAHHYAPRGGASHGPEFTSTFLTLLELVVGPEAALLLRMIFADNGVQTVVAKSNKEKVSA